jgi:tight adherence protein B
MSSAVLTTLPMGIALGLIAGVGLLLVLEALTRPRVRRRRPRPFSRSLGWAAGAGATGGALGLAITGLPVVGLLSAAVGCGVPSWWRRRVERRRHGVRLSAWPDAVDDLRSQVRAGMALPDAVGALARTGPVPLRPCFAGFLAEYRASGSFRSGLGTLDVPEDPLAQRVVAALTVAREVGGSELGTVLAALSTLIREDARARAEIIARQSWTVTAARLAVAAPWLTLAVMSTRPGTVAAYQSMEGAVLLCGVALTSLAAYLLMARIGRLPVEAGGRA